MSGIQPRTLSDEELIRYCATMIDSHGLPVEYQVEMLRRLTKYTPYYEPGRTKNPDQLELFK